MSNILNNLKSSEKEIIENLAATLRKKLLLKKSTLDQKIIQEYRKADDQYNFNPRIHMNLSK